MERPTWFTKGQMDILVRIAPHPIGSCMSIKEAAKDLDITPRAAYQRLAKFKKRFPEAWKNFYRIKLMGRKHRRWLQRWEWYGNMTYTFSDIEDYSHLVKEQF